MPCKTCATESTLQVCLFCGHSFCSVHRTERDGVPCCTACNEAEHARASGRAKAASARVGQAVGAPVPGAGAGRPQADAAAAPPPPPPAPEPGWWPLLGGLAAAGLAGAYLWWLVRWLEAPGYAPHAAAGAGAAFVFGAVWLILRSRLG